MKMSWNRILSQSSFYRHVGTNVRSPQRTKLIWNCLVEIAVLTRKYFSCSFSRSADIRGSDEADGNKQSLLREHTSARCENVSTEWMITGEHCENSLPLASFGVVQMGRLVNLRFSHSRLQWSHIFQVQLVMLSARISSCDCLLTVVLITRKVDGLQQEWK